jgi:acetyl-CoA decarbonylase/synthase complex subunit gamma
MAKLTGIEIYKHLPKTNCGECNFPTCMAFAMGVASKKVGLEQCPYISEEAKEALSSAAAPPMRTVVIGRDKKEVKVGGETVLFRHEEKFHNPTAFAIKISDEVDVKERVKRIEELKFVRVGQEISVDLVAVEHKGGDFQAAVKEVSTMTDLPLVLLNPDPDSMAQALKICGENRPLIWAANDKNYKEMASLAKQHRCPLAVCAPTVEELALLSSKVKELGVEDIILDPNPKGISSSLVSLTNIRRLALKNFRPLGYPTMARVWNDDPFFEAAFATTVVCKYGSIVVLEGVEQWEILPLLTVRQNIYTDPQVPNAIEPKLYKVGEPKEDSPVLVTTNFALTYFTVEGEVENSKLPSYITVVNTEGLGVLNAYADDKFTAERIIKAIKEYGVMEKVKHNKIIIPGLVAVLRMEIQEEAGWEVIVGPEDAAGIPSFLRSEWKLN